LIDNRLVIALLVVMIIGSVIVRFKCRPTVQKSIFAAGIEAGKVTVLWITILSRTPSTDIKVRFDIISLRQIFRVKFAEDGSFSGLKIGRMYWERRLNVLLFIPFGYLICTVRKKLQRWWRTAIAGIAFSMIIEMVQLLTSRGWFDLDDLFLNTVGALIGYGLYRLILSRGEESREETG